MDNKKNTFVFYEKRPLSEKKKVSRGKWFLVLSSLHSKSILILLGSKLAKPW